MFPIMSRAADAAQLGRHRRHHARPFADPEQDACAGPFVNCGWGTGGFKATPGSGHVFAHLFATGEPNAIAAPFTIERFRTGALINEATAAAVAH